MQQALSQPLALAAVPGGMNALAVTKPDSKSCTHQHEHPLQLSVGTQTVACRGRLLFVPLYGIVAVRCPHHANVSVQGLLSLTQNFTVLQLLLHCCLNAINKTGVHSQARRRSVCLHPHSYPLT